MVAQKFDGIIGDMSAPTLKPTPAYPFREEDAEISRQSFLRAHMTPKVAILAGKLFNLLLVTLLAYMSFNFVKLQKKLGDMKVMIVRINDVGRAEAVRLDTDYTPQEPELREQMERFVIRFYTKQGFSIPEAIEALPGYMEQGIYDKWRKQAMEDLTQIASGQGLRRVRILSCRIDNPADSKTTGTTATVRFATDAMTTNGAFAGGVPEGYEAVIRFKIGVYPELKDKDGKGSSARDQWIVRNPLGMKVSSIEQTRYIGADVEDPNVSRIIDVTQRRADDESKKESYNQQIVDTVSQPAQSRKP